MPRLELRTLHTLGEHSDTELPSQASSFCRSQWALQIDFDLSREMYLQTMRCAPELLLNEANNLSWKNKTKNLCGNKTWSPYKG